MVEQYPHSITVTLQPELLQDESGNLYQKQAGVEFTSACRFEPAGSNDIVYSQDGDQIRYTWNVFMPVTSQAFTPGDRVLMTLKNGGQYNGIIKKAFNGQLNTRLWV